MRNTTLHAALQAFVEESAMQLSADAADGEEIPFEVVESRGHGAPLYCYRPLTGAFIRKRLGVLARLPAYPAAARAVEAVDGLERYLERQGERRIPEDSRIRADATLRVLLSRVFADRNGFGFDGERFRSAYEELEAALYEGRSVMTMVAPLAGVRIAGSELPLGDGVTLARGDSVPDAPEDAVWDSEPGRGPRLLAVVAVEQDDAGTPPLALALTRLRRLLSALRLYEPGCYALGPLAWARPQASPWRPLAIASPERVARLARGPLRIPAEQEDELRAFCSLIARRTPRSGEVAWALRRFELGAGRPRPEEMLSDHLLALRALLEPEGPASGRLAQRLAVICAVPEDRAALAERISHAVALERATVAGMAPPDDSVEQLAVEVADHLRALLRDVLCGHLDSDLRGIADDLLADSDQQTGEVAAV